MLEQLQVVFREVFENPDMIITEDMSADDVEDWTSLVHMQLLSAIEENFGISFSSRDIRKLKNIGELVKIIRKKLEDK